MAGSQETEKALVELYRCKNFVAASMTSVYASHTKITENGDIVVESIGRIEDRHLVAAPTLPSLEKRTSQSMNKNLYDLSLQLADESENSSVQSSHSDVGKIKDKPRQKSPSYSEKMLGPKPRGRQVDQLKLPKINQPTQNKTLQAEVLPNLKVDSGESFRYCENPKKAFEEVLQRTQSMFASKKKPKKQKAANLANKNRREVVNVKEEVKAQTIEKIKLIVKFIDDNYLYTLLILLGTLAYLGYVLFYDISEHLNAEQRYLGKMQNSYLVMRCFYYVMRRLRVPIF